MLEARTAADCLAIVIDRVWAGRGDLRARNTICDLHLLRLWVWLGAPGRYLCADDEGVGGGKGWW
jgi:hypothetical protein